MGCHPVLFFRARGPISVNEAARRLNVSSKTLYTHCRLLAKQLALRRREFIAKRTQSQKEEAESIFRAEARKLLCEGLNPTYRRVSERLGYSMRLLQPRNRPMFNQIMEEERRLAGLN